MSYPRMNHPRMAQLGVVVAWISRKRVVITVMPQIIPLYNGIGCGAASCYRG